MANYNNDHRPNAIERDRMERRRQLRRKSRFRTIRSPMLLKARMILESGENRFMAHTSQ